MQAKHNQDCSSEYKVLGKLNEWNNTLRDRRVRKRAKTVNRVAISNGVSEEKNDRKPRRQRQEDKKTERQ